MSNNGGIAPYINQACARSNHPEACRTAIQPFVSVCLPKEGNVHTSIRHHPLPNENYVWITRTEAARIFALPHHHPTEDPCPISESEMWYGQKPNCPRGTEWRCPEMADSRAEYRNQPVCERQEPVNCARLSESSCKAQSSACTRKAGSSFSSTGYRCIRQDGQPATDTDCKPSWTKPSCGSTLPTLSLPSDITIDTKLLPNNSPRNKCHESRHYAVTVNNPSRKKMKISTKTTITNGYGGTIYDQQDYNNSNISTTSHQFIVKTGYSGDVGIIIKGNILITIESEGNIITKQINFTLRNPEDVFGKPCDAF